MGFSSEYECERGSDMRLLEESGTASVERR